MSGEVKLTARDKMIDAIEMVDRKLYEAQEKLRGAAHLVEKGAGNVMRDAADLFGYGNGGLNEVRVRIEYLTDDQIACAELRREYEPQLTGAKREAEACRKEADRAVEVARKEKARRVKLEDEKREAGWAVRQEKDAQEYYDKVTQQNALLEQKLIDCRRELAEAKAELSIARRL